MGIIVSDEIRNKICEELRSAKNSVQIITAYCKISALTNLISNVNDTVKEKKLMVRFRLDDLAKDSTDFEVLSFALDNGWDVFIRFDLHAKTYIVDNKRGIIGSANTTSSGLSFNQVSNLEIATITAIEKEDITKIDDIFLGAVKVDYELIEKLEKQYKSVEKDKGSIKYSWDNDILSMFNPKINILFSHDLPNKKKYEIGEYISFLDSVYQDDKQVKLLIRDCNAYRWFLQVLSENNNELYYGALSAKLHDALVSDPKPYRKDVKEMLSNFLSVITRFGMDEIVIDVPNYSQRIRRV